MFSFLESSAGYGATGCKLIYTDGKIQYTCASTFPTPFRELSFLFLLNRIFPQSKSLSARELDYWDHMDSREVDCLSGACIMAKSELIVKLGGFDEKLFMYAEDLDLCYRILKEGFNMYYLSTEVIIHYEGASSRQKSNMHFATLLQMESNYYFMRKNYGEFRAKCFRVAIFAGSLFRVLITAPLFIAVNCGLVKRDMDLRHILSKYTNMLLWSIHIKRLSIPA
jgi:GT2 family glycosyltransferase